MRDFKELALEFDLERTRSANVIVLPVRYVVRRTKARVQFFNKILSLDFLSHFKKVLPSYILHKWALYVFLPM
jgi:hypothetical protein